MNKGTMKKVLIAAVVLLITSIGFAMVSIFCEGGWRSAGIALWLATFLPSVGCFLAVGAFASEGKKKGAPPSRREDKKYEKMFPHITTDDDSSDEEKEVDDYIFMDMMDDDDDF